MFVQKSVQFRGSICISHLKVSIQLSRGTVIRLHLSDVCIFSNIFWQKEAYIKQFIYDHTYMQINRYIQKVKDWWTCCKTISHQILYTLNVLCLQYFIPLSSLLQDPPVVDLSGQEWGTPHHEPAESGRPDVPPGCLLPHQDPVPHPQDRAEGEM